MDLSPEQVERSRRTIRAAAVFAENSEAIVAHVAQLPADHVVVAVVTEDYLFDGVHHVARTELVQRVPALEENGWAMVFSEGADTAHVGVRTTEMITLAEKRIEMISRINARRRGLNPCQSGSGPDGGSIPCWRSRRSRNSSP